jgi:hypothetical protein
MLAVGLKLPEVRENQKRLRTVKNGQNSEIISQDVHRKQRNTEFDSLCIIEISLCNMIGRGEGSCAIGIVPETGHSGRQYRLLSAACCLLSTVCCVLSSICCLLCAFSSLLPALCSLLSAPIFLVFLAFDVMLLVTYLVYDIYAMTGAVDVSGRTASGLLMNQVLFSSPSYLLFSLLYFLPLFLPSDDFSYLCHAFPCCLAVYLPPVMSVRAELKLHLLRTLAKHSQSHA